MNKFSAFIRCFSVVALCVFSLAVRPTFAAGAVEMQVEHILVQSIDEYNLAMESSDSSGLMKYFTDNVQRRSPLSEQTGKKDFSEYFAWEFKTFQAK